MFINPYFLLTPTTQRLIFLLNTLVLIAVLVLYELLNIDHDPQHKAALRLLYPVIALFISFVGYAAYAQFVR